MNNCPTKNGQCLFQTNQDKIIPNAPGHTTKDFTDLVSKLTTDQLLAISSVPRNDSPGGTGPVGGWTNPSEKYACQTASFPQGSGWKEKNVWNHHLVVNLPTLTETNSKFAPENRAKTKRKRERIPSIHELRCHSLVSGRIHFTHTNSSNVGKYIRTYTM